MDSSIYTHSRTRTTSSNTFPSVPAMANPIPMHLATHQQQYHPQQQVYQQPLQTQPYPPQAYNQQQPPMQQPTLYQPQAQQAARRTPSVNTFSSSSSTTQVMQPPAAYRTSPTQDLSTLRRSPSTATGTTAGPNSSTSSGALGSSPQQQAGGSLSYVALLRRQKATVWCDRSQTQDPRLAQAQRQAKMRAALEVLGAAGVPGAAGGFHASPSMVSSSLSAAAASAAASGASPHAGGFIPGVASGRTGSGISSGAGKVAAKIRHHGKPGVVGYGGGLLGGVGGELGAGTAYVGGVGGGVPLRLSATEVEDGEDEDGDEGIGGSITRTGSGGFTGGAGRTGSLGGRHHSRTGSSGRSSTASLGRRATGEWHRSSGSLGGRGPAVNAPSQHGSNKWPSGSGPETPERTGSLVVTTTAPSPTTADRGSSEPFPSLPTVTAAGDAASGRAHSSGSGRSGSSERLDAVGELTPSKSGAAATTSGLQPGSAAATTANKKQSVDDLKRRGSVDERTMTLTQGRLFIANPD